MSVGSDRKRSILCPVNAQLVYWYYDAMVSDGWCRMGFRLFKINHAVVVSLLTEEGQQTEESHRLRATSTAHIHTIGIENEPVAKNRRTASDKGKGRKSNLPILERWHYPWTAACSLRLFFASLKRVWVAWVI